MQVVKLEYNTIPFLDISLSNRVISYHRELCYECYFQPGKRCFLASCDWPYIESGEAPELV